MILLWLSALPSNGQDQEDTYSLIVRRARTADLVRYQGDPVAEIVPYPKITISVNEGIGQGNRSGTNHCCGDNDSCNSSADLCSSGKAYQGNVWCMVLTALSKKMGKLSFTIYDAHEVEVHGITFVYTHDVSKK
jgi:hypothetical protein